MKLKKVPRSEWHKFKILKLSAKQLNVTTGKDQEREIHVESKCKILFLSSDSSERDSTPLNHNLTGEYDYVVAYT